MRIRQAVLVARDLDPVVAELCAVLGIEVAFHDPAVREFGLRNAVMPIGDTFLEVVCPVEPDTAAGRYLERRRGDGGYMVIVQSEDLAVDRRRLAHLGVRIVWQAKLPDIETIHLHPRDTGGALLSLDQARPPESWRWAGPEWRSRMRTSLVRKIAAAELQSHDPRALAERWAEVLARDVRPREAGGYRIRLDDGELRFVEAADGRGEGLGGLDVEAADREAVIAAARARQVAAEGDTLSIGGARIRVI